jgi:hypothetical protein
MSPELILFSPDGCEIQQLTDRRKLMEKKHVYTISSLLQQRYEIVQLELTTGQTTARTMFYMNGGTYEHPIIPLRIHPLDEYDDLRNKGHTKKLDRYARQVGKKIKKKIAIDRNDPPVYTAPSSILNNIPTRLDVNRL